MESRAAGRIAVMSRHLAVDVPIPADMTQLSLSETAAAGSAQGAPASGDRFVVRPLQIDDHKKGFYEVLGQLTTVGETSEAMFQTRFQELQARSDTYFVRVIEDTTTGRVVGTATLLVERKFVHGNGIIGHIEDVVVDKAMRGHDLGKRIIDELMKLGNAAGCYKVILDCAERNIGFYKKCGFEHKEVCMAWYIPGRK